MNENGFDQWGLVELFGHARIAGRVMEQQIGGASFIRVDVPELEVRSERGDFTKPIKTEILPAFSRYFGAGAIYSITPTSEEVARLAAEQIREQPVNVWIQNLQRALPGPDPDSYEQDL